MEHKPERNYELRPGNVFDALNHYFLLFFGLSCLFGSVFVQQLFAMFGAFRLGIAAAPIVGVVLPCFLITRRYASGFRKQFHIRSVRPATILHVTLATLAMVVVVDHVYVISQQFMPTPEGYLEGLRDLKPDGAGAAIITFVGLCLVVPISEELIFRGIIQHIFAMNMGGVVALVLAGTFFGIIHLNPPLLLSMVCFGLFLGFIFFATSNLIYTMLSHGLLNTVAFLQLATVDDMDTAPFYTQEWWHLPVAILLVGILLREIKRGAATTPRTPDESSNDSDLKPTI